MPHKLLDDDSTESSDGSTAIILKSKLVKWK